MVGLAIIMILVAVVFLLFLMLSRNLETQQKNPEMAKFLEVTLELTSSCSINGYEYLKISDLIEHCNRGTPCIGGKSSCLILKEHYTDILNSTLNRDQYTSILFRIDIDPKTESSTPLAKVDFRECQNALTGDEKLIPLSTGEKAILTLKLC